MKKFLIGFLFLVFLLPAGNVSAQEQCDLNVGPELPLPGLGDGDNVICGKGFEGVASVINNIRDAPFNSISCRKGGYPDNKKNTVLRVDVNVGTTRSVARAFAEKLNTMGEREFPGGVKLVVLGVEMSNLEWWGDTSQSSFEAGRQYATEIFVPFSETIARHDLWPVAPAPPDLYNADYDPVPWIDGFLDGLGGRCDLVDALTADVFDVSTDRVPYDTTETWRYLEERICNKKVVHFEGWGGWPELSVKDQVEWYKEHSPPVSATTLVAPNCGSKRADGSEWWYYVCGKVYKADGSEVDPDTCGSGARVAFGEICDYNAGDRISNPEFHSLRPYPACPYEPVISDVSYYMCGNDLVANERIRIEYNDGAGATGCVMQEDGSVECEYDFVDRVIPVNVDLSETSFPIMGLTEGPYVNNSESRPFGTFTDAQRVNEYVSWYLNGTTYRAEENYLTTYGKYPTKEGKYERNYADVRKLIDYSGPLKKLLPRNIQNNKRVEQIAIAGLQRDSGAYFGERGRHDQIAACTYSIKTSALTKIIGVLGGSTDLFHIPGPCYPENEGVTGDLKLLGIKLGTIGVDIEEHRLTDWWASHLPPNPDSEEFKNKSFNEYWKKYRNWRGEYCTPTVLGLYMCFDEKELGVPDLGRPNYWGQLFNYIPFSSTEDRIGYAEGDLTATGQPGGDVAVEDIVFEPAGEGDGKIKYLYFPHMQETSELGELLQSTYVPEGRNVFNGGENRQIYNTERCEPVESRVNPGDRLYGDKTINGDQIPTISGDIRYSGTYKCRFTYDPINDTWSTCDVTASTALSIYSAVPKVEEVWDRYVNGQMSVFKRFYPKVGVGAPVEEIKDIPAEGELSYTSSGENGETWAGDPGRRRPGSNAKIYFPHIGSIYDYFLKGIQKALRPFAAGLPVVSIGNPSGGHIDRSRVMTSIECPSAIPPTPNYTSGTLCKITPSVCSTSLGEIPIEYQGDIKNRARDLAAKWVGEDPASTTNYFDLCYPEVVKRSLDAGVNPIYTLAIWIQESGASNYERFYCDPADPKRSLQDFGINDTSISGNFDAQIKRFLRLPYLYPNFDGSSHCFGDGCNLGNFSLVYQQGAPAGECKVNDAAVGYAEKTLRNMTRISPNCQPLYPTDMSCSP